MDSCPTKDQGARPAITKFVDVEYNSVNRAQAWRTTLREKALNSNESHPGHAAWMNEIRH